MRGCVDIALCDRYLIRTCMFVLVDGYIQVQREIIEAYMQDFKLLEEIEGEGGRNSSDGFR